MAQTLGVQAESNAPAWKGLQVPIEHAHAYQLASAAVTADVSVAYRVQLRAWAWQCGFAMVQCARAQQRQQAAAPTCHASLASRLVSTAPMELLEECGQLKEAGNQLQAGRLQRGLCAI